MKRFLLLLFITPALFGQWIVNDPVNTAVNTAIRAGQQANHLEVLRQWAEQLNRLNQQLRQLEEAVTLQRRIRDVLGDPTQAGTQLVLRDLGAEDLARTYGETLRAIQRLSDASQSLNRTSEGLYRSLNGPTALKRDFIRDETLYRRYSAVERQADNFARVQDATGERLAALQADLARTLTQLQGASTAAEVDKLNVKVSALNSQIALLAAQRRDEADKLAVQQTLNANQAEKERQDFLEKQIAEERDSLRAAGDWQRSIRLTPTNYTDR